MKLSVYHFFIKYFCCNISLVCSIKLKNYNTSMPSVVTRKLVWNFVATFTFEFIELICICNHLNDNI